MDLICNHLEEEAKAGCFAFIVLKMYCYYKCSVALPLGAVGWSAVVIVIFSDHNYFLVIFVCIVFEQGDKLLTLSSMYTLIVESNLQHCVHNWKILAFSCQKCEFSEFYECLCIIEFIKLVKNKR